MIKERIRELCKSNHISVTKLEELLGLGNGAIGKWDKFKPKSENLEKVADYFGVSTDYLLGRTDDKAKPLPVHAAIDLDTSALDKALAQKAYDLMLQMPPEMQKAAIAQLRALADLNKKEV